MEATLRKGDNGKQEESTRVLREETKIWRKGAGELRLT